MNRIQNGQPTTYVKEEAEVNHDVRVTAINIIMSPDDIDNNENDMDTVSQV